MIISVIIGILLAVTVFAVANTSYRSRKIDANSGEVRQRGWLQNKGCLALLVLALLSVAFVGYVAFQIRFEISRPTYYENGSDFPVDRLPPSAHDVRFAPATPFSPCGRAYEFKCSESDYRSWVNATRKKKPILGEIRTEKRDLHPSITREGKVELVPITNFLVSAWQYEDQGLYLVYDKAAGRAIMWSHSR